LRWKESEENLLKFVVLTAHQLFSCRLISAEILFVCDVHDMVFVLTFLKWQISCAWPASKLSGAGVGGGKERELAMTSQKF